MNDEINRTAKDGICAILSRMTHTVMSSITSQNHFFAL